MRFGLPRVVSCLQIALHIFSENIAFEVDGVFSDVISPPRDGQADTVNGDRPFWHDVASELRRDFHAEPPVFALGRKMRHAASGVHMSENEVSAEFLTRREWLFQIDSRALCKRPA